MEEQFIKEDSKMCRTNVAGTVEGHTLRRTQETRQVQGSSQGQPLESIGIQTSGQQDLVTPLARKWICFSLFKFLNLFSKYVQLNFTEPKSLKETLCHIDAICECNLITFLIWRDECHQQNSFVTSLWCEKWMSISNQIPRDLYYLN